MTKGPRKRWCWSGAARGALQECVIKCLREIIRRSEKPTQEAVKMTVGFQDLAREKGAGEIAKIGDTPGPVHGGLEVFGSEQNVDFV